MSGADALARSGRWIGDRLPVSIDSRQHHQRRSNVAVSDQVVPVVCLLALIALTVLGSTLALFYWFASALTPSSLMLCPDIATCIVERADAEADACGTGGVECSVPGATIGEPVPADIAITP